ncbi:MAG: HNH endonuclease [Anaerolineae bacterium]
MDSSVYCSLQGKLSSKVKIEMARDEIAELYRELINNEFSFMERGESSLTLVYEVVQGTYPDLCDDDYLCFENCSTGNNSPEWQHAVRRALYELKRKDSTEVENSRRGYWVFKAGTFSPVPPDFNEPYSAVSRSLATAYRIIRDTRLTRELKALYHNRCQICQQTIPMQNGQTYSEAHHIQPLGSPHNGPDVQPNILILCPNHHAMCDYGSIRLVLSDLYCHPIHVLNPKYIDYHNVVIVGASS